MSAGWIAQGADTPAATSGPDQPHDPWTPVAPDTASVPALVRPHQIADAHPVDTTRGFFTRGKDLLFGHEPENAQDADQAHVASPWSALAATASDKDTPLGAVADWAQNRALAKGPDNSTLLAAYPHLFGADVDKFKAGIQETVGGRQAQDAQRQVAALTILPQVAERVFGPGGAAPPAGVPGMDLGADATASAKYDQMAKDPLVAKTARSLGISPQEFAADWGKYAGQTPEQLADQAARAKTVMDQGTALKASGTATRNQAWADQRAWQPSDLANGGLDPWSLKGMAFNVALAAPQMAAITGAAVLGTAVGGPGGGIAAGGATAAALMAPGQREDIKNKLDDQVTDLLQKADRLDALAPVGQKRGLNPYSEQLRQQAADLSASSDSIANTAGLLYGVSDVAGAVPVSAVLSRSPLGKAMLDRMVGSALAKTLGGRIAGNAVANGAGGALQAAIQKGVDTGIVHEDMTLSDALKDIAYAGISTAVTTAPFTLAHEAFSRTPNRDTTSSEFMDRVKSATQDYSSSIPKGYLGAPEGSSGETITPQPGTNGPSGETGASGAGAARQAYQTKASALNEAAAAAQKRSDVTLEPEEEGWSVHVKGQPVAQFDTVTAAREAMAQARKVVGTKPVTAETVPESDESIPEVAQTGASVAQTASPIAERAPETALERTQPIEVERRSDTALRTKVSDMSPEQMKAALLTHELSGIPNLRAYDDSEKKATQVSVDADSLKWFNTQGSHAGGDQLIKAIATAMHEQSPGNAYHKGGDEFVLQADSPQEAESHMAAIKQRLAGATIDMTAPDGRTLTVKGIGVTHGIGKDFESADRAMEQEKANRTASGLRAGRDQQPPGATFAAPQAGISSNQSDAATQIARRKANAKEIARGLGGGLGASGPVNVHAQVAGEPGTPKGVMANGGGGSVKVLNQEVKRPAVPTAEQARTGNYFKPTVQWHGLPISVENVPGQTRRGIGSNGKPFARKMTAAYGDFAGTKGADGDGVDVMMGPHHEAPNAYVIDQLDHTGKTWDEHKVQIGVRSAEEARQQYLSHYPEKWRGLGGITELNPAQLKRWLHEGDLTTPINPESVPTAKLKRGAAPDARHDSILQYLARHPLGLDRQEAESQGVDKADMALSAAHVGIKKAFRRAGMSFDHAAETLHQEGYPVNDEEGHYSPNVLLDRISDELRGKPHYSTANESHLPQESWHAPDWRQPLSDHDLEALSLEQTRARLAELQKEQERLEREIERAGLNEGAGHETEEDLDRIPFQRKGGGQQDLFGDQVLVQNEIKRLEAALDKKRNSGQESTETERADDLFSAARQQMDLGDAKDETTHYEVREPRRPAGPTKNVRAAAALRQLDIFANADLPHPAVQAARLAQSVKLAHIGEFRSGVKQVKSWEDAAHILAPLRKYPQENVTALVLDKAGTPLAVIRHSIGQADAASVEPWSLAGSVVQVPGAAQVFFAHNHPSGFISQSMADEAITKKLHNLLDGSGIVPRGMIVVGPNNRSATFMHPNRGSEEAPITSARRRGAVPLQERRFARLSGDIGSVTGREIKGPTDAIQAIKASGESSGVVLSNNRHQVVGIVPMSPDEMMKLRTGNSAHGAARLLKAMAEANSNVIVAFGPVAAARNVAVFGNASGARALDAVSRDRNGAWVSSAGDRPLSPEQTFLQRQFTPPAGWPQGGSLSTADIRGTVDTLLEAFGTKPEVVIAKNLAELKRDPVIGPSIADTHDGEVVGFLHPATGKIYLVGDQLHSPADVAATLAHEYITHFGLRAAFGNRGLRQYQEILNGVAAAMPAELRTRGEQEFPKGFNPLNAHQRNVAAEEVLAYYGQRYAADQSMPAQLKRWFDKLRAMIRDWIRTVMGLPKKFDELFVKRTLADLESFLRRDKPGDRGKSTESAEPAFAGPEDTFFSGLAKAVDAAKREKGTGAEWEATLRNMPGVKDAELQWTGLKDWLEGRGRVTKAEVADYVAAHRVQLGEVLKGDPRTSTPAYNNLDIDIINERLAEQQVGDLEPEQEAALRRGGQDAADVIEDIGDRFGIDMTIPDEGPIRWSRVEATDTKFGEYTTPGGANYRELLMTLPTADNGRYAVRQNENGTWSSYDTRNPRSGSGGTYSTQGEAVANAKGRNADSNTYRSSHWDEPNVLAHIRFDDRTGPQGERVLHLAEIQSDWHQQGRRQGYAQPLTELDLARRETQREVLREQLMGLKRAGQHDTAEWHALHVEYETVNHEIIHGKTVGDVPNAPFKTTWPELAMKRMLRFAAEGGYDALSWDTGDTNAERYNMQQVADRVTVTKNGQSYDVTARKGDHTVAERAGMSEEQLAQMVGKDMAQKAISAAQQQMVFRGDDLKVGGTGMRAFYDSMLPLAVNKLVKKWGSTVEPSMVPGEPSEVDPSGIENAFSVHQVAITPAMRDSVMQGQPMFLKRRKGSSGVEPPAPKKGAYDLVRRAIAAIPQSELNLSLRRIVDPTGVSEAAGSTALRTREMLGQLAQAREETLQTLERYAKQFDLLGTQDRYDFIDAMETGAKQPNADLQPAADTLRTLLDDWREKIRSLGVGALDNFIENYFPHIWQNDTDAKKWLAKVFGRRPLKGPASFLKERTIPTTKEGLEAGLTPISTNPLILAFAKLGEMQKFHEGVKFVQGIKDEKLAVFKPSFKPMPEGWAKIEDAVGRVLQWSEQEQGFIERGHYIMPADAARILNNHLGGSALRNFLPAQLFRVISNAANALQLGFSAFHLGFTTLDAVISKNAVAIERLLHGEPLKAAGALLEAAIIPRAVAANIARGYRLRKAYGNLPGAPPEMQALVKGLMAAGGTVKMDRYFLAAQGISPFHGVGVTTLARDVKAALQQPSGAVLEATKVLGSFPLEYATKMWRDLQGIYHEAPWPKPLMTLVETGGRLVRASTAVIMEHIVPLQKLGVFSDLAADHLRRNPAEDPVATAAAMQHIWNSVDNRLGEMVYNNIFWNRTFKDVLHMLIRAVGWNLGTVRELFGAPFDAIKVMDYLARGAPAEESNPSLAGSAARKAYQEAQSRLHRVAEKVGHKIPYTLALVGTTMVIGAVMQYLLTGKGPEEVKDYFFPWTGRMTKYGTKERISLPSYMKDLYEYATQPATTVINKANPIFGIMHAIYANEDFFGNAVRNPDAPAWRQMIQGAQYAAREVLPFSLQGTKQFAGAGALDAKGKVLAALPYVGFGPAPARVTSPEQMERYQLRETEKSYIRGLQRQLKAATEKNDIEEVNRLRDEIRESKLKERGTERDIRQDRAKAAEAAEKISSLIRGQSREDAAAALEHAGLPAFAALWRSLPDQPRPRVAQSLEDFA